MAAKYKSIQLKGSRDSDIAQWCILLKEQWNGGINYLVKRALRNYMRDGSFICIGKIHKCKDEKRALSQQSSVSLWFGDSPDIAEWIDLMDKSSIRPATLIREIIRKSITIIPDTEEEWIPTCLDFGTDIFERANSILSKSVVQPDTKEDPSGKVTKRVSSDNIVSTDQNKQNTKEPPKVPAEVSIKEVHTFDKNRSNSDKKPPRAAALSGRRFSQH